MTRKALKALVWVLCGLGGLSIGVAIVGLFGLLAPGSSADLDARGITVYQGIFASVSMLVAGLVSIAGGMLGIWRSFAIKKTRLYRAVMVIVSAVDVAALAVCLYAHGYIFVLYPVLPAVVAIVVTWLSFKLVAERREEVQAAQRIKEEKQRAAVEQAVPAPSGQAAPAPGRQGAASGNPEPAASGAAQGQGQAAHDDASREA